MGYKTVITLLMLWLSVTACTTSGQRQPRTYGPGDDSNIRSGDPLLLPPDIHSQDLEGETLKLSRIEQLKRSPVAVWIDGAGFDAIESLGFLQTLDKAGIKPSLVVGTGFGCWVSLSWAIDGSANRAEWQSFKWSDWGLLGSTSILNRIRGRSGQEDFAREVSKLFPSQKLSTLKVANDCVYIEEQNGLYFYKSSIEDRVEQALWTQLQITPLVDNAQVKKVEEESKRYSGYGFNWPDASALRFAAMEAGRSDSSYTWIVLRGFRGGKALSSAQVKLQSQKSSETLSEMTTRGLLYTMSSSYPYTLANIKDTTKRRVYLLRGRKEGEKFLNRLLKEDIEDGTRR
jgi:hypothetical protein